MYLTISKNHPEFSVPFFTYTVTELDLTNWPSANGRNLLEEGSFLEVSVCVIRALIDLQWIPRFGRRCIFLPFTNAFQI